MVKVHVESVREIVLMFEGLVSVDTYGALMLMRYWWSGLQFSLVVWQIFRSFTGGCTHVEGWNYLVSLMAGVEILRRSRG